MEKLSLKELAVPIIKAIDSCNYLLKPHHRRTAVIAYHIGKNMGWIMVSCLRWSYLLPFMMLGLCLFRNATC